MVRVRVRVQFEADGGEEASVPGRRASGGRRRCDLTCGNIDGSIGRVVTLLTPGRRRRIFGALGWHDLQGHDWRRQHRPAACRCKELQLRPSGCRSRGAGDWRGSTAARRGGQLRLKPPHPEALVYEARAGPSSWDGREVVSPGRPSTVARQLCRARLYHAILWARATQGRAGKGGKGTRRRRRTEAGAAQKEATSLAIEQVHGGDGGQRVCLGGGFSLVFFFFGKGGGLAFRPVGQPAAASSLERRRRTKAQAVSTWRLHTCFFRAGLVVHCACRRVHPGPGEARRARARQHEAGGGGGGGCCADGGQGRAGQNRARQSRERQLRATSNARQPTRSVSSLPV